MVRTVDVEPRNWGNTFGGKILGRGTAGEQCHQGATSQLLQRVPKAPPLKALRSTIKRGKGDRSNALQSLLEAHELTTFHSYQ